MGKVVLNKIRGTIYSVAGYEDFVFSEEIYNHKDSVGAV